MDFFEDNVKGTSHSGKARGVEDDGGSVHIFIDTAWLPQSMCISGVVLAEGHIIAYWYKKRHAQTATQAETLAPLLATKTAISLHLSSIIFHTDARELALTINRKNFPSWDAENIVNDFFFFMLLTLLSIGPFLDS